MLNSTRSGKSWASSSLRTESSGRRYDNASSSEVETSGVASWGKGTDVFVCGLFWNDLLDFPVGSGEDGDGKSTQLLSIVMNQGTFGGLWVDCASRRTLSGADSFEYIGEHFVFPGQRDTKGRERRTLTPNPHRFLPTQCSRATTSVILKYSVLRAAAEAQNRSASGDARYQRR